MAGFLSVGLVGPGLVGAELLRQIGASAKPNCRRAGQLDIKITAICNSTKMLFPNNPGAEISVSALKTAGLPTDLEGFVRQIISPSVGCGKVVPVLVDCTTSQEIAAMYPSWLRRGVNVVTPNKKAFSSSIELFREIENITREEQRVFCFHEATVGAGLPVIDTLHNLIDTGDEVLKIEGILSGTMSYIFSSFSTPHHQNEGAAAFSEIVREAKTAGLTEPDPRDDLNGVDIARKTVILGRICGMELDLAQLPVENVVPPDLRMLTPEKFMEQLGNFDSHFDRLKTQAADKGKVLRYVCSVEPPKNAAQVALKEFDASHPLANLTPGDNLVAFTTRRYRSPLIVQGAGGGAGVTAAGVFGDLLKVARLHS